LVLSYAANACSPSPNTVEAALVWDVVSLQEGTGCRWSAVRVHGSDVEISTDSDAQSHLAQAGSEPP